jgi:hypothetical protein
LPVSVGEFPIDRRAIADHAELGLSEARGRGGIKALEAVGFLDPPFPSPDPATRRRPTGSTAKARVWSSSLRATQARQLMIGEGG